MKIIFFDTNKKLCELATTIPLLEVKNCNLSEIEADAVSTCSNPKFSFSGGIDFEIQKRFSLKKGNWLEIQKGDKKIKNVVLNITVLDNLATSKEFIRRAYANFFNLAKNQKWETVAVCGFGSGTGQLSETIVIEALREAMDMYLTIIGKKNSELIEISDLILDNLSNLTMMKCENATTTKCWNATTTKCWNATMTECENATMTRCGYATMTNCVDTKMMKCENATTTKCENATTTKCWNATMTECGNATMTECGNATMTRCVDTKMMKCEDAMMTRCEYATITNCREATITKCWNINFLYSSGESENSYISDIHKSELNNKNPLTKEDYKKWFLLQFLKDKKYIAYKFLTSKWESPIFTENKIIYEKGQKYKTKVNKDILDSCGEGINLATLDWCKLNNNCNGIYVEFEFNPKNAIIPENSNGKFRVSKCTCIDELTEKIK